MKTLSLMILAWITSCYAFAQFQHSIGTDTIEIGRSVKWTAVDKGYVVGGSTRFKILGSTDATLIKTKPDGSIIWSAVYGKSKNEIFNSVRDVPVTNSPNLKPGYAALGATNSFGFGSDDVYFVRTDQAGTPIFAKVFGKAKADRGYCLQYIKDSNVGYGYVIAGETSSYTFFGGVDAYIIKTDEFGNLVKATVIGGPGNESAYWIEQTRDQGYIVVGTTTSSTCGSTVANQDIFAIKLDINLNIVWNAIIGGGTKAYSDIGYAVVENPVDGSYTITGTTRSFGVNTNGDAFLLNLKSTGAFNWMKTYGMKKTETANSILVTRNPASGLIEYVVGGWSTSYNATALRDAYVFKTDDTGNLLWTALYGSKTREVVAEITDSGEQGYIFAGEINANWSHKDDIYLTKMDFNGKTGTGCELYVDQKVIKNDVCSTSSAQQVFVEENLRIDNPYKYIDYKVEKCDPASLAVVEEQKTNDPVSLSITSQNLVVTTEKQFSGGVIKVFNQQGNLTGQKSITSEQEELSLNQFSKGLYIIHVIKSDGSVIRKKFIKE